MRRPERTDWIDRDSYRKQILAGQDAMADGVYMQIVEIKPQEHVDKHYHEQTQETFYILDSGGTLIIDDHELTPDDGDVIICEPGDVHEVRNETETPFRILVVKTDAVDDDTVWL